jgi:outer membrane protein assembly factor BamB
MSTEKDAINQPNIPQHDEPTVVTEAPIPRKPLRLWPGVVAASVVLLARFIVPSIFPATIMYGMAAGALGVLAIIVWWIFFSRARWAERLGALALIAIALFATSRIVHVSIATGAMGYLFPVLAVPVLSVALVAWALVSRHFSDRLRRTSLLVTILFVCGVFTVLRTGGFTGDFDHDFAWRWSKTHEERLLTQAADEPAGTEILPAPIAASNGAYWPGFRGSNRDGIVRGVRIATDWSNSRPVELWRRQIGPGWSSFAVQGDRLYTQEQRGEHEIVSCYHLTTGKPVWRHRDAARFWESNAGPGPRGTPTLSNGRVYSLGATGVLNALDASNGSVVWSRNAASDTKTKVPGWGFTSSPLVVDDIVIVATAGNLAAYNIDTGEPRWFRLDGGVGYSSPHLATIGGVVQILLLNGAGAISVAPADGTLLWQYPLSSNTRIVQPALTADGDVLVHDGEANGMRRLAVAHGSSGWTAKERWISEGLNPYFNDFVVHKGHAYGFDASNLACIDLNDGNRKWKGGSYGHGQLVLLADQDALLVLSEKGELALVGANPNQFTEFSRFKAIEGKTWNHPVVVGDVLLARNGVEMVAYRLSVQGR